MVHGVALVNPATGHLLAASGGTVPLAGIGVGGLAADAERSVVPPRLVAAASGARILHFARLTVPERSHDTNAEQSQEQTQQQTKHWLVVVLEPVAGHRMVVQSGRGGEHGQSDGGQQLAAPGGALRRVGRAVLLGATALAVSSSWLVLVTRPADRPYLDGTTNPFALVFGYNGISRFGGDAGALGAVPGTSASRTTGNTGWGMLVNHTVGPQIAWLLPRAVLAALLGVLWRAGQPRGDLARAGFLLWGGWLALHVAVFSTSNGNHAYYTAVIAPALAALSGGGLATFWREYRAPQAAWHRAVLPAAIALTSGWALLQDAHTLKGHCSRVSPRAYEERRTDGSFTLYYCRPTAG